MVLNLFIFFIKLFGIIGRLKICFGKCDPDLRTDTWMATKSEMWNLIIHEYPILNSSSYLLLMAILTRSLSILFSYCSALTCAVNLHSRYVWWNFSFDSDILYYKFQSMLEFPVNKSRNKSNKCAWKINVFVFSGLPISVWKTAWFGRC